MRLVGGPVIIAIAIAGCQFVPGTDAHRIEAAKDALSATLRDPTDPLFTDVHLAGDYVCGEVNALNEFGGRSGPEAFIVHPEGGAYRFSDRETDNAASWAVVLQAAESIGDARQYREALAGREYGRCRLESLRSLCNRSLELGDLDAALQRCESTYGENGSFTLGETDPSLPLPPTLP